MNLGDVKVLVATPNYMNQFEATVHTNHLHCSTTWTKEGIDFNWTIIGRSFVHFARTQMCQIAVEGGFTHILWLDDDAIIEPDILPRFIEHDKDVVIAPYCLRKMPHDIGVLKSASGDYHDHASYRNLDIADMDQGLIEIDGGGTHCMLVKTEVLTRKGVTQGEQDVPVELQQEIEALGERGQMLAKQILAENEAQHMSFMDEDEIGIPYFVMPKVGTEDMYWCYRAKRKGIEIWCDTDVFAGHMGFTPVVSRSWREHTEKEMAHKKADQAVKMAIIPGDNKNSEGRNHYGMHREKAVNLV